MTKRRRWAVAIGSGAIAALVCAFWLYATRTAITEANAERIGPGMTLAEVEAILGGPARDESTGPLIAVLPWRDGDDDQSHDMFERIAPGLFRETGPKPSLRSRLSSRPDEDDRLVTPPSPATKFWVSNQEQIRVDFDDAGRVQAFDWQAVRRMHENAPAPLRRWFGQ